MADSGKPTKESDPIGLDWWPSTRDIARNACGEDRQQSQDRSSVFPKDQAIQNT
jgi:hypothetical protein